MASAFVHALARPHLLFGIAVFAAVTTQGYEPQRIDTPWHGTSVRDLHNEYYNIFRRGNRNAASHLWSTFLLERAHQMTEERLRQALKGQVVTLFVSMKVYVQWVLRANTPISIKISSYLASRIDDRGSDDGIHLLLLLALIASLCGWQFDKSDVKMKDLIRVDTRNVTTQEGEKKMHFLVIGNPCEADQSKIPWEAPEVVCNGQELERAILSDHGYIIISMFFPYEDSISSQDEGTYAEHCEHRKQMGYNSGMGEIFRKISSHFLDANGGHHRLTYHGYCTPTEERVAEAGRLPYKLKYMRFLPLRHGIRRVRLSTSGAVPPFCGCCSMEVSIQRYLPYNEHGHNGGVSDNEDAVYLAGYEGGDAYYIDTEGSKRVETDRLKRRVKTLGIDESDNVVVQVLVNVAKGKVDHFRRRFDPTTSTSRFIPNNAVVIVANSSMLREVEEYEHVSWMAHMRSEWKVAQDLKHHVLLLQQKEIAQTPKFSTKLVQIRVILLGGDVSATIAKEWESTWGINFLSYAPGEILFQTSNTNVTEIVEAIQSHENVHWIERVHEKKPMNWMGAKSLQGGPNSSQPLKIWDKGITGKGQKESVKHKCCFPHIQSPPSRCPSRCLLSIHIARLDLTHCFFQPSSVPVCERCGRSTYYEQSVSQATALADYWKNKACQSSFWDEYVDQSYTAKQYIRYFLYYYTGNYTIYSFTNAQFTGCASNPPWVSRSGQISCSITGTGCDTLATDQRKVQAYLLNTDAKDYKSHGTHVSGSVAGYAANANASINRFKGQAYEADLIFSSGYIMGASI
eukprot:jgi/Bigna1/70094/fgenesh1_pg.10_\